VHLNCKTTIETLFKIIPDLPRHVELNNQGLTAQPPPPL
jgi:hypothetical protein